MGKNLIVQKRGRGTTSYRAPSFNFKGEARVPHFSELTKGVVADIVHCPGHTAPLALVEFETGEMSYLIAPQGIEVGQELSVGATDAVVGNTMMLKNIPEGTEIYNLELQPGDGGKLVRSSGTKAIIGARVPGGFTITLPSKKLIVLNESCRATIGVVAGGGRTEKPLLKAGIVHYKKKARNHRYPIVGGASMNAVSHPFGNKRTSRKARKKPMSRNAPPGRKVGTIASRRTGRKKK